MDSLGVSSFRCRIRTWKQEVLVGELNDAGDKQLREYWSLPKVETLAAALSDTQGRKASQPEDEIYSVLGMLPNGGDLQVVYGQSRNSILRRAVNAGLMGAEVLCSRSVSFREGESWAGNDGKRQHIGDIYSMPQAALQAVSVDDHGLRARFHRLEGVIGYRVEGFSLRLKLKDSDKEIACMVEDTELTALAKTIDQVLLLEEGAREGYFGTAVLSRGTGINVHRLATAYLRIQPWMKIKTQVVIRIIG